MLNCVVREWGRLFSIVMTVCANIFCLLLIPDNNNSKKSAEGNLKWFIFEQRAVMVSLIYDCVCAFSCSIFSRREIVSFFNYLASKCLLLELEVMSCMLIKHEHKTWKIIVMRKRARKSKTNDKPTCKFEAANSSFECKKIKGKLE